jgi:hypothetical protein
VPISEKTSSHQSRQRRPLLPPAQSAEGGNTERTHFGASTRTNETDCALSDEPILPSNSLAATTPEQPYTLLSSGHRYIGYDRCGGETDPSLFLVPLEESRLDRNQPVGKESWSGDLASIRLGEIRVRRRLLGPPAPGRSRPGPPRSAPLIRIDETSKFDIYSTERSVSCFVACLGRFASGIGRIDRIGRIGRIC